MILSVTSYFNTFISPVVFLARFQKASSSHLPFIQFLQLSWCFLDIVAYFNLAIEAVVYSQSRFASPNSKFQDSFPDGSNSNDNYRDGQCGAAVKGEPATHINRTFLF